MSEVKRTTASGEVTIPRHLVVVAANDDGYGKAGIRGVYPFATADEASHFADAVFNYNIGIVMGTGGYPGQTQVIDLANPDDLDDPDERLEDLFEAEADYIYTSSDATSEEIAALSPGAKRLILEWLKEDEDAEDRTWLHGLREENE